MDYNEEQSVRFQRELDLKMSSDEKEMSRRPEGFPVLQPYAVYLGEQDDGKGGHFSLYNVIGGKRHGTTLTEKSIKKLGIRIKGEKNV